MKGFIFKYNKYEKPSSKSYLPPEIEELEILSYEKIKKEETGKIVFEVDIRKGTRMSDNIKDQLTLFFMNKYGIKAYNIIELVINEIDS